MLLVEQVVSVDNLRVVLLDVCGLFHLVLLVIVELANVHG